MDTPRLRGGEYRVFPPARGGQEARWTPLCGVFEEAVGWTPRGCGVENIECSPPPAMGRRRGGPRRAGS